MLSHGGTKKQLSRLQDDMDRLRMQLAAYSEQLGETAGDAGRHGLAGLREAYDHARVYSDQARRQAEEATGKAREQVKAHPLSTMAGAFAVGIVLGALLGRR